MEDTLKQLLGARRLRQRGLALALADSAVLAMEIVGEFLSLHQDKAIFTYFRRAGGKWSISCRWERPLWKPKGPYGSLPMITWILRPCIVSTASAFQRRYTCHVEDPYVAPSDREGLP